jgi:LTXXQ motif family protein
MRKWLPLLTFVLFLTPSLVGSSLAQESKTPTASTLVLLPGAITGLGSYGPLGYWRLCNPLSIGLSKWHVGFIERLIRPDITQVALLSKLADASSDATKAIATACPDTPIATGMVQIEVMRTRITGLLNALNAIREPYTIFYNALDDRQKRLLDALGPNRRGWRL